MTSAAMKGSEKDLSGAGRGDFVELDGSSSLPAVRIDGPYGAPAEDVFDAEVAVLVGAGIGKILTHFPFRYITQSSSILRCTSFRIYSQAYLVSPTSWQHGQSPSSRILLGLS